MSEIPKEGPQIPPVDQIIHRLDPEEPIYTGERKSTLEVEVEQNRAEVDHLIEAMQEAEATGSLEDAQRLRQEIEEAKRILLASQADLIDKNRPSET